MALIEHFDSSDLQRPTRQRPAAANLSVFDLDGVTFLQIDTFGTPTRQMPGKRSQSIRLGREAAIQLRDAIDKAFRQ